ncbi:arylamine N-acetyltransferase family protein [Ktedonospora formicarum]|uniref:Acetyltransferase n=1 Tax=Ktedonospora formicarum TaxID=2778364 RepID=A0A8J3IA16_9CHLR|nr:arylamine N-acetyltransferase [Ktedonospora formicarum]GHO49545.1 acetyltransferase [Ktedonospora formicarum]
MDILAYLRRLNEAPLISLSTLKPTLEALRLLHEAHLVSVPFENLDIHCGLPLRLDEEVLFQKIVGWRRGGICYELNALFARLLRELGYRITYLSAEVAAEDGTFGPEYGHLALLVRLKEGEWLADVGFSSSFRKPLHLEAGKVQMQRECVYRLARDGENWILQQYEKGVWRPLYRFNLRPRELRDFAHMCHYQQTSPDSYFTQKRLCTRATTTGRLTLCERQYISSAHGKREERNIMGDKEYMETLARDFGIMLPPSVQLRWEWQQPIFEPYQ